MHSYKILFATSESNVSKIKYTQPLKLYITPVYKFKTIMSHMLSHLP